MAARPTGAAPAASAAGPVVTRRVGLNNSPGAKLKKPSIRKTIESMVSTGSQAEYFKPDQTIIIFDWDDTLCPSSWIRANRRELSFFRPAPKTEKFQKPLKELQVQCEQVLKLAMKLGSVIIVTNAMEPWVETSCRNFLPQLLPLVLALPITYARSIFETQNCEPARTTAAARSSSSTARAASTAAPGMYSANGQNRLSNYNARLSNQRFDEMAPQRWKEVAFEQEINGFYSRYAHQSWKNVISIGDSVFERAALRRVVLQRPTKKKCRSKTLKLFDDPDIGELIAQVKIVHDVLSMMVQYDGELDIEIDEEDLKIDVPLADRIVD